MSAVLMSEGKYMCGVGVADDILFNADEGPSIAPSVPGSNMPDLPTFNIEPQLDLGSYTNSYTSLV